MRRPSRTLGTELWREVIETLDEGVVVFNDRGIVIYANDKAAGLLAYAPRDVLELDREDFVSLCQPDRLEGAQFASTFLSSDLPDQPDLTFEVATTSRRLSVTPFRLRLENGEVLVVLLHEVIHWRSDLITQTIMSSEMQGSLAFASSYSQALLTRLESGEAHQFELVDLARIVANGVERLVSLWDTLARLHSTDPVQVSTWVFEPTALADAIDAARSEVARRRPYGAPDLQLDLPADLPRVAAAEPHLHAALCAILEATAAKPTSQAQAVLSARHQRQHVQVDLRIATVGGPLQGYLFDALPVAIAEQVIIRHGGRLWIEANSDRQSTLRFSLPVWSGDRPESSAQSPFDV